MSAAAQTPPTDAEYCALVDAYCAAVAVKGASAERRRLALHTGAAPELLDHIDREDAAAYARLVAADSALMAAYTARTGARTGATP